MTTDQDLFTPPTSEPPALEAARRALLMADQELSAAELLLDEQGAEAKPHYDRCFFAQRRAARIVGHLETEELKRAKPTEGEAQPEAML